MTRHRLILLLLLWLAACVHSASSAQARYALMIACGEHSSGAIPRLLAPPNDIRLMASVLTTRYDFQPSNIAILGLASGAAGDGYDYRAPHAAYEAIRQALAALADPRRIRPGDFVVIYITGHGTSIADSTSPTLNREWLVTYDQAVRDDTLKRWVAAVRGHVTLILDTCYSGGLIKGRPSGAFDGMEYDFVSKALPPDVAIPQNMVVEKTPPFAPRTLPFTVLAACGSEEQAQELRFHRHGRSGTEIAISGFTWALYHTLVNQFGRLTFETLRREVTAQLQATQCLQHPVIRPGADPLALLAPLFEQANAPHFAWTRAGNGQVVLQAGYFAGIRPGMRFVIDSGRKTGVKAMPTTTVQRCSWFDSELASAPDPNASAGWIDGR